MSDHQGSDQSPSSTLLYCGEDASEMVSSLDVVDDVWISHSPSGSSSLSSTIPPPCDEFTVDRLIESEPHHMPLPGYLQLCRDRSIVVAARQDSINWILKVHAFYRFNPVTALLSVNYFDRFLSSHSLPQASGWPFQLLSVACLSLAAKMEEPEVPLLLHLQLFEPRLVFEPKTVQRMELRVMSILNWRLNSVTPFHFLHYFISKLPSSAIKNHSFSRLFSSSSDLIFRTTRVVDFLGIAPSTIAAAAVLCAAGESLDSPVVFHERVNREMVRSCHQLMEEYLIDTCPSAKERSAEPEVAPPSPVGVLDAAACGSCDTRSENPGSTSQAQAVAEPSTKRLRFSAPDVQQP